MSDPMSHVEIEDVLSSIRRLVSQDLRPGRVAPVAPAVDMASARPQAQPAPDSKLLLTPALRVVSDVSAPVTAAAPEPAKAPLPRLHLGLETRLRPVEPAFDMSGTTLDGDFEADLGDPYPEDTRLEWSEEGWVLADVKPEPEPPVDPWAAEEYAGLAGDDAFAEPVARGSATAEAQSSGPSADEAKAEAEVQPPQARPETQAALEPEEEPLEVVFDEQVLREMVRDILREELQGRMGERMTRNIRKLVHAEVARLIATQELD